MAWLCRRRGVRAASGSFLSSRSAVMRSACAVLEEPTRRTLGLRSLPGAHRIEPAHGPARLELVAL